MATEHNSGVDYAAVLADLEAKKAEIENAIKGIQAIMGIAPAAGADPGPAVHVHDHHAQALRFDTFFGMKVIDAIRVYLEMSNRTPRSTPELVDALSQGGLKTNANSVSSILSRKAAEKGIIKLSRSKWGLQEWYPGARIRKPRPDNAPEKPGESPEEKDPPKKDARG